MASSDAAERLGVASTPTLCACSPRREKASERDIVYGTIYSARLGRNWRVLYEIDDTKHAVIVLDIRHRAVTHRPHWSTTPR